MRLRCSCSYIGVYCALTSAVNGSQVYMAKNKQTDEVVAIKKIRSLNEVQGVRSVMKNLCGRDD